MKLKFNSAKLLELILISTAYLNIHYPANIYMSAKQIFSLSFLFTSSLLTFEHSTQICKVRPEVQRKEWRKKLQRYFQIHRRNVCRHKLTQFFSFSINVVNLFMVFWIVSELANQCFVATIWMQLRITFWNQKGLCLDWCLKWLPTIITKLTSSEMCIKWMD